MTISHDDVEDVFFRNHLEVLLPLQQRFNEMPPESYRRVAEALLESYAQGLRDLMLLAHQSGEVH